MKLLILVMTRLRNELKGPKRKKELGPSKLSKVSLRHNGNCHNIITKKPTRDEEIWCDSDDDEYEDVRCNMIVKCRVERHQDQGKHHAKSELQSRSKGEKKAKPSKSIEIPQRGSIYRHDATIKRTHKEKFWHDYDSDDDKSEKNDSGDEGSWTACHA